MLERLGALVGCTGGGSRVRAWVAAIRASSPTRINSMATVPETDEHNSGIMREAQRDVATYFPTAIVSGRSRDKVYNFVRLDEIYYAGSHGMDIKGPSKRRKYNRGNQAVFFLAASEFLPMIDEVYEALLNKTSSIPGEKVENNKFCLSVLSRPKC
ncbi:putative trehalose-phosphate phosphatase 6 [Morella rubra]|uniref:Putative trehalose-phosphate phosphatase 6 n=1 Tax=Morella rubra TaxID=262757 RepID=A0A6A1WZZ6_9ROSI|nr:putative trehalose-phosphate phosphatase 6 [Morella rubra]